VSKETPDSTASRARYTEIVRGLRCIPDPPGIAESQSIKIGGVDQRLTIRGRDVSKPLLLFVHGGPGVPEATTSWLYQNAWEEFFVVVQWDQRGCGRSLPAKVSDSDRDAITVSRMIDDGEEVMRYLLNRFDRKNLVLLGHSWGTLIGVTLAHRCPELLSAYVGIGQVIHSVENERVSYEYALRRARETETVDAIRELTAIAQYPSAPERFSISDVLTERKWVNYFGGMVHRRRGHAHLDEAKLLSPDYSDEDLARAELAFGATLRLLPEILSFDATTVTHLDCPVFIFAGRHDYATPSVIAAAWLEKLEAPRKKLIWFERSAHMIQYEEPGKVLLALANDVLPLACA
jgi:pimeloyl-ACP methyl ester carboxylesterase